MSTSIVVISGTRCSGKSTIAREFVKAFHQFVVTKAITTRAKRPDDTGNYEYMSDEEFHNLKLNHSLFADVQYQSNSYGIKRSEVDSIITLQKTPIILVAPECIEQLLAKNKEQYELITFFIDAKDDLLEERYEARQASTDNRSHLAQRMFDRNFKSRFLYRIENNEIATLDEICLLIYKLWKVRNGGGLLPKHFIWLMIKCGMLIVNADKENIKSASYDLTLGYEYYQGGAQRYLDKSNSFIKLLAGDFALIESREIVDLPRDIAGKFDVRVELFCKGIILSNGPQVDPGFKGRLFCLIFNPSNEEVHFKLGDRFATIEFVKLLEPSEGYQGKYQDKESLIDYLPKAIKSAAIVENIKDIQALKHSAWWEKTLPLIISIVSFATVMIGFFYTTSSVEKTIESNLRSESKQSYQSGKYPVTDTLLNPPQAIVPDTLKPTGRNE